LLEIGKLRREQSVERKPWNLVARDMIQRERRFPIRTLSREVHVRNDVVLDQGRERIEDYRSIHRIIVIAQVG